MVIPQTTQTCPVPFPAHTLWGAGKSQPLARRSLTVWRRADCGMNDPCGLLLGRSQASHRGLDAQERQTGKAEVRARAVCAHLTRKAMSDLLTLCRVDDR